MRKRLGPLSAVDHAALVRLCNLKKVIRRDDGYGTEFRNAYFQRERSHVEEAEPRRDRLEPRNVSDQERSCDRREKQ